MVESSRQPAYSPLWLIYLLLAGLFDPIYGIYGKLMSIVRPGRLSPRADTPARRRRGLTLILGGIEGPSPYNLAMARGVLRSRYRGAVVRVAWNDGVPVWRSLVNLMWPPHQERQVALIVAQVCAYRREHPAAPICIVAQSGGCWIALRVLESLPPGVRLRTVALIAPSVSPGYDIRAAAERCESRLVSFGSAGDFFFLGLGTILFGTSDRVFSPSAGLVGWHHQHERFVEIRWHPVWLRLGNLGNHTSSAAEHFIARVVCPLFSDAQKRQISQAARLESHSLTVSARQG